MDSYSNIPSGGRKNNRENRYSLDSIMLLRLVAEDNETIMVTLPGVKKTNCNQNYGLSNGINELQCIINSYGPRIQIERKSIAEYMSSEEIELYNQALAIGNYDYCSELLKALELSIRYLYGKKGNLSLQLLQEKERLL